MSDTKREKSRLVGKPVEIRSINTRQGYLHDIAKPDGKPVQVSVVGTAHLNLNRETVTYEVHPGPPYKTGGPFLLRRYKLLRESASWSLPTFWTLYQPQKPNSSLQRSGKFLPKITAIPFVLNDAQIRAKFGQAVPPSPRLETYGPTFIAKANPLKDGRIDLVRSLAELKKEGLPSLKSATLKNLKHTVEDTLRAIRGAKRSGKPDIRQTANAVSGDYLNALFGVGPIVSDVINIINYVDYADKWYRNLVRINGKTRRIRKRLLTDTQKSLSIGRGVGTYPLDIGTYGDVTVETIETTQVWGTCSGRFYIPDIESPSIEEELKRSLFAKTPSLSLIYELTPWSWLADWFTNLGDLVQNLDDLIAASNPFDPSLKCSYIYSEAYIMRHKSKTVVHTARNGKGPAIIAFNGTESYPPLPPLSVSETFETKERVAATPFGFGLTFGSLSNTQKAILAALAINKKTSIRTVLPSAANL